MPAARPDALPRHEAALLNPKPAWKVEKIEVENPERVKALMRSWGCSDAYIERAFLKFAEVPLLLEYKRAA